MDDGRALAIWQDYLAARIDMSIHESDHMSVPQHGLDSYRLIGKSAVWVIWNALALSRRDAAPKRILDFASGAGRVARHLRAMFPGAEMFFSDYHRDRAAFCATTFGGELVEAQSDFRTLKLPDELDLVWIGSLFTHLSYDRTVDLFDAIWPRLAKGGVLVATFHGRAAYEWGQNHYFIEKGRWHAICRDYQRSGFGYRSYGDEGYLAEVGVTLSTPQRVIELAQPHTDATLLSYAEAAWTNFQDVGAWQKR